jgi:hypothetical protein
VRKTILKKLYSANSRYQIKKIVITFVCSVFLAGISLSCDNPSNSIDQKDETITKNPGWLTDSAQTSSDKTNTVKTYTLTVRVEPPDAGSVEPSGGTFNEREIVTLRAKTHEGFEFQNWSGDINSSQESISFHMVSDMEITATFQSVVYFKWKASAEIQNGVFSKPEVLAAICYGIDERRISQEGSNNFGERIEIIPDQEYAEGIYSPSEAKRLLIEAGYPNGFKVDMYIKSGNERLRYIAFQIQDTLQYSAILVDIHIVEPAEYYAAKDHDCILVDLARN